MFEIITKAIIKVITIGTTILSNINMCTLHIHIYIHVFIYINVCMSIYIYECVHHIHVYICICMDVCIYVMSKYFKLKTVAINGC